jgi:hypothetical protein
MWEEADKHERNTVVFSAAALFEKIGLACSEQPTE